MSLTPIPKQYAYERTTVIFDIQLDDQDGQDIEAGGLSTLTATMTSLDTGLVVESFEDRDVIESLAAGVLALEVTADDLVMLTTRPIERRAITLSATYGTGREWHAAIPVEVRAVVGVG